jgi:RHS repeat-associated protein
VECIELSYTPTGQLAEEQRYNFAVGTPGTGPQGATDYQYDAASRVTSIVDYASGTPLLSYTYSYDAAGNVTEEVDNGTAVTYTYDADNELTGVGASTTTYDATGNRTGGDYSTGTGNELLSDGTWDYSYDAAGNLTEKVNISTGETWKYGYDNDNQMICAQDWTAASDGSLISESVYKYDAFGNRIEQDVTVCDVTTVQRYALDGWDPAKAGGVGNDNWDVWADLNCSNSLTTRYLNGDAVDQLFGRIAADGTAAWLLADHLGSVVGVTDGSGVLKDTITYDAWGNVTYQSDACWTGRYTYAGYQSDTTTGFLYARARYYDPATGRWTSQDPLGFGAGDNNLYRYVNNEPTNHNDSSGLLLFSQVVTDEDAQGFKLVGEPLQTLGAFKVTFINSKQKGILFKDQSKTGTLPPKTKLSVGMNWDSIFSRVLNPGASTVVHYGPAQGNGEISGGKWIKIPTREAEIFATPPLVAKEGTWLQNGGDEATLSATPTETAHWYIFQQYWGMWDETDSKDSKNEAGPATVFGYANIFAVVKFSKAFAPPKAAKPGKNVVPAE